jgi:hypothetical protein
VFSFFSSLYILDINALSDELAGKYFPSFCQFFHLMCISFFQLDAVPLSFLLSFPQLFES